MMTEHPLWRARSRLFLVQLAASSISWAVVSNAAEIYRWVSDDGVVHYSDTKPKNEAAVTTLEYRDTNPEDYDPATNPYSILNQAKRVNASWSERVAAQQQAESQPADDDGAWQYASPPYAPYTYYPAAAYYPVITPPRRLERRSGAAPRQLDALAALDLVDQRPQSINSGVHRDRVLRSEVLPIIAPDKGPGMGVSPRRR